MLLVPVPGPDEVMVPVPAIVKVPLLLAMLIEPLELPVAADVTVPLLVNVELFTFIVMA